MIDFVLYRREDVMNSEWFVDRHYINFVICLRKTKAEVAVMHNID